MTSPDVVVVGGGPVGLAAAIALRQRGFDVLITDRAQPPIDKPCGEGLMPDGVAILRRLGIEIESECGLPFRGIRFTEAGYSAEGSFAAGNGLGIRRTTLHQHMIDQAAESGIAMRWGETARAMDRSAVEIGGRKVTCRWVVGADGRESAVRQWAGLYAPPRTRRRIGLRQHFQLAPWTDFVEVHWHDRGQAVVTPVARGEVCVSLLMNGADDRFPELLSLFPELQQRLNGAQPTSAARGAISGSAIIRSVVSDRVALVGDAAGAVDALTGEGLSLGFRHAIALADALAQNNLPQYERAHRRINRPPELMARLMLLLGKRRRPRRRVLRALAAQSRLFTFMLSVHTGAVPVSAAPLGAVAGFFRRLIIADSIRARPVG
ncbi:MAG TPA: NAD(P)/FAD-dependent oxidoreductase [Candidatus Binataceae bacterium]|nr:NAD(P)/FAD-dependent oxidoreductase [Candidatus Binataceae bacterium]